MLANDLVGVCPIDALVFGTYPEQVSESNLGADDCIAAERGSQDLIETQLRCGKEIIAQVVGILWPSRVGGVLAVAGKKVRNPVDNVVNGFLRQIQGSQG